MARKKVFVDPTYPSKPEYCFYLKKNSTNKEEDLPCTVVGRMIRREFLFIFIKRSVAIWFSTQQSVLFR